MEKILQYIANVKKPYVGKLHKILYYNNVRREVKIKWGSEG